MSTVEFEDFKKLDIRVGRILEATKVEGSSKLIKLSIEIGAETKQAIAGIIKYYDVPSLVGKLVIVVTNLKPKEMMGLKSEVMVLAAFDGKELSLLRPDKDIATGSPVS
ncbi:MAG: methionine--tRNA ligase subunit beta [Nitrososphaerota archaeon]|jgi:methionine--tRNA ligase beta chain|nr:methionine--tRNA ligase subunit beta [Nitrososphaerota archaeon]MDG7035768.1 methionine--tRNA ligase subunit beta [Nitrososphaerota archaeon]MDG7039460.1 methionine--tRNA ligase subunit beta [Nitrososphaerota archaeon]MDG7040924.1 methionine--tRNA ligase subunit beta [Nitrososphaerota archaeon]MDG7042926.1 methionine--tRNA ligase subunit beta [Nitrososphaerota archaeon]